MKSQLKENIKQYISISDEELDKLCDLFTFKEIKKKDFFLKQGEICREEAFVINGLMKIFHTDKNGVEQILYFGIENWWFSDFDSFIHQKPSDLNIQALEDTQLLCISFKNKEFAYQNIPIVEKLFRIMLHKTHTALQRRMLDNLSKTAEERYWQFLEKYPKIAQRLTNIQMAGYIGVSHEFISKIRRRGKL